MLTLKRKVGQKLIMRNKVTKEVIGEIVLVDLSSSFAKIGLEGEEIEFYREEILADVLSDEAEETEETKRQQFRAAA